MLTETSALGVKTTARWMAAPPGMRHIGIIDLGSNTARLVLFTYTPGRAYRIEDMVRERVRLGEGLGERDTLSDEAMERAVETLKMFKRLCDANEVDEVICAATAATRDAANGAAFLGRVEAETGLTPRVISGEEEGYYGYLGAANSLLLSDAVLVDIGGGSVELTQVVNRGFKRAVSLPMGTVRMTERYLKTDPVKKSEFSALQEAAREAFSRITWLGGETLIGMGGTARALAKMDRAVRKPPLAHLHGYTLTRATIDRLVEQMRGLPIARRADLPGLSSDRADVMLGGAVVLQTLMDVGGYQTLTVSNQGVREGIFYELFLGGDRPTGPDMANPPLIPDIRTFGIHNLLALFGGNHAHFAHVRRLALSLFDQLRALHGYGAAERDLLSAAAWLHDVGIAVDYWEHHLHSEYIILNAPLPGWTLREIALIALLTRNHRKGSASVNGLAAMLDEGDETRVVKLAALLRLAEYLERSKTGVVRDVQVRLTRGGKVAIEALATGDASVEIWEANRNSDLFRRAFGYPVEITLGD